MYKISDSFLKFSDSGILAVLYLLLLFEGYAYLLFFSGISFKGVTKYLFSCDMKAYYQETVI